MGESNSILNFYKVFYILTQKNHFSINSHYYFIRGIIIACNKLSNGRRNAEQCFKKNLQYIPGVRQKRNVVIEKYLKFPQKKWDNSPFLISTHT